MRDRIARWLEMLSGWALAGLLLTLPFWRHRVLVHRVPEAVFFEFHDMMLYTNDLLWWGAMGAWVVSRFIAPAPAKLRWGPRFLLVPLLGFLVLSAIGIPFALDRLFAGYQTLRLFLLLAFYLLLVNAPLRPGAIVWPLAAGMVLQAIVAVPQFFLGHTLGLRRLGEITMIADWPGASVVMVGQERYLRAYGFSQHPNLLAGCLMTMLLIVVGYYLVQRGWRRLPLLLALGAGFGTLLLTFSRAAWIGALVGVLVVLTLLLWAQHRGQWSPDRSTIALLIVVLVVLSLLFVVSNWPLLQPRLGLVTQGTEIRSIEARTLQVPAALELIQMRPALGVGLGNYPIALYRLARDMVAAYPTYQPVYNVPLLVTAELGILGGLLWVSLVSLPWLKLWLRRRQVGITPWWAGVSGALLALTVTSLFDYYVWASHQGWLMLGLVLGLWARAWEEARNERQEASPIELRGRLHD
jgi:O-antigen ligase